MFLSFVKFMSRPFMKIVKYLELKFFWNMTTIYDNTATTTTTTKKKIIIVSINNIFIRMIHIKLMRNEGLKQSAIPLLVYFNIWISNLFIYLFFNHLSCIFKVKSYDDIITCAKFFLLSNNQMHSISCEDPSYLTNWEK